METFYSLLFTKQKYASNLLFFIILISSPLVGQAASDCPIKILSATMDPDYDSLHRPGDFGWLGADGASSIQISKNKILWLFGDTILGARASDGQKKGPMVRNTIGIQKLGRPLPGKSEYYWTLNERIPESFFPGGNHDLDYWYWPLTGALVEDHVYIFLSKLKGGIDIGGLSFQTTDTHLVRISNPQAPPLRWKQKLLPLGFGDDHLGFSAATFVEKPYLYVFGIDDGPEKNPKKRQMVLSRIHFDDLKAGFGLEGFRFWAKGPEGPFWSHEPKNLEPLFTPGVTETGVQYHEPSGLYLCTTHKPFQPEIYLTTAPKITGPWSEPVPFFTITQCRDNEIYHAYAMKIHPPLARNDNEIIVSYVVNSTDFWSTFSDPDIYYPRFVRVKIEWE